MQIPLLHFVETVPLRGVLVLHSVTVSNLLPSRSLHLSLPTISIFTRVLCNSRVLTRGSGIEAGTRLECPACRFRASTRTLGSDIEVGINRDSQCAAKDLCSFPQSNNIDSQFKRTVG